MSGPLYLTLKSATEYVYRRTQLPFLTSKKMFARSAQKWDL